MTERPHIRPALVVCLSRGWTSLEASALASAEILRRCGTPCEVGCLPGSPIELEARGRGFGCVEIKAGRFLLSPTGSWLMRKWITGHPDAVVFCARLRDAFVVRPGLIGFPAVRLTVATLFAPAEERRRGTFGRWIFRRVDALIAHSQAQKIDLLTRLPVPASRVAVLAPAVDLIRFRAERRSEAVRGGWHLAEGELAIGVIGQTRNQVRDKGGDGGLLQALAIVARNKPRLKWKLVVFADPTEFNAKDETAGWVRDATVRLGVERVEPLGPAASLPDFCANVDLFVSKERPGAFDVRLLESMASGVPTLASAGSRPQDSLKDGRASLTWRSGNPWDLARQLERAILDPHLRSRVAGEGRQLARTHHDAATFERGLIRLITGTEPPSGPAPGPPAATRSAPAPTPSGLPRPPDMRA